MTIDDNPVFEDERFQSIREKLNDPNIFFALSNTAYEIRHSNFIAWLLDKTETHGQGDLFLRYLMPKLFPGLSIHDNSFSIFRERYNIDLLLVSEKHVLVIENKTLSTDTDGQLKKYRLCVQEKFPNRQAHFSYLTAVGEPPNDIDEHAYWKSASYSKLLSGLKEALGCKEIEYKVRMYVEDYIDSVSINLLKASPYNVMAKNLVHDHKKILPQIFANNSLLRRLDPCSRRTISFIRENSSFTRGNGFFRKEGRYYFLFTKALKINGFTVISSSNTTYLSFVRTKDFSSIDTPLYLQMRFYEQQSAFRFGATILPESEGNKKNRELLLKAHQQLRSAFKKNYVESNGKHHIGVFSKKIEFNPIDLDEQEIESLITDLVETEIIPDARKIFTVIDDVVSA